MARREEEESREAGRVFLPKLPQEQGGRQSSRLQCAQLPQEAGHSLGFPEVTSSPGKNPQAAKAWIQGRRLRAELDSLGRLEQWLAQKPARSRQEQSCWQRIRDARAEHRRAAATSTSATNHRLQSSLSRSSQPQRGPAPLVCVPCPQALATLHELLQLRKLRVVDVFRKAGMAGRKIKRQDFIRVIRETNIPISNKDLEAVVLFLTSSKPRKWISLEDLIDCQQQWLEMEKEAKSGVSSGIRYQMTTGSGQVTSWTSSAFTSLSNHTTGHMPCSAWYCQPSTSTLAAETPSVSQDTASGDTACRKSSSIQHS